MGQEVSMGSDVCCRGDSMPTYSVLGLNEGIVDSDNVNIVVLDGIAQDNAADTTETVDADLDTHVD